MKLVVLEWARRLAAIAQTGLAFSPAEFDRQRYLELRSLAAEMAAHPDGDVGAIYELFVAESGYATPKVICRGAVLDQGHLLMVKEAADGLWTIPGGWVEVGDSPAGAVVREVEEETGLTVSVTKLAAVYDKLRHDHPPAPHHAYLLFFLCERLGGTERPSFETFEVGWFGEGELPELSTGRATAGQLRRMFEHYRHPELPTDFD